METDYVKYGMQLTVKTWWDVLQTKWSVEYNISVINIVVYV